MSHRRYYLKQDFAEDLHQLNNSNVFRDSGHKRYSEAAQFFQQTREKQRLTAEIGLFVGIIAAVVESVAFRRERNTATVVARELSRSLARRVRYGHTQTLAAWR